MTLVTAAIARGSPIRSPQIDAARAIGSNGNGVDAVMAPPNLAVDAWQAGGVIVAFSVSPSGVGPDGAAGEDGSVSEAVAAAVRVVRESGLPHETSSMFTSIEGEWDEVMDGVKRAVFAVAETSPRVGLVLKADLRAGHDTGQMGAKVERIESVLSD